MPGEKVQAMGLEGTPKEIGQSDVAELKESLRGPLAEIKAKYDPQNLFKVNRNVSPSRRS